MKKSQLEIVFARQPDGKYQQSGDLPKGTRFGTVQIDDKTGLKTVKKVSEWLEILQTGPLVAERYTLRATAAPKSMSDETKLALKKITADKKAEKEIR